MEQKKQIDLSLPRKRVRLTPEIPAATEGAGDGLTVEEQSRADHLLRNASGGQVIVLGSKYGVERKFGEKDADFKARIRVAVGLPPEQGKAWPKLTPESAGKKLLNGIDHMVVTGELDTTTMKVDVEAFLGYTKWERKVAPPCTGFWDIIVVPQVGIDIVADEDIDRLWFVRQGTAMSIRLPSGLFIEWGSVKMAWRGLTEPWPDGYQYEVPGAASAFCTAPPNLPVPVGGGRVRVRL